MRSGLLFVDLWTIRFFFLFGTFVHSSTIFVPCAGSYILGSFQNSTNSNLEKASHLFFRREGGCSPNTLFLSRIFLLILYQYELAIIAMENLTG